MRLSLPMARATSWTSAPVASQKAAMLLIELIRCARKALAVSLLNSLLQRLVRRIRSAGTQWAYTAAKASIASGCSPPIKTRSGCSRSPIAVPSARNSGLESTAKVLPLPASAPPWAAPRIAFTVSAVRTGRVLFSTTIVWPWAQAATWRAEASIQRRSLACPAPRPLVLVGVLTDRNTMSAAAIDASTSVVKKRLRPRQRPTTASSPGS